MAPNDAAKEADVPAFVPTKREGTIANTPPPKRRVQEYSTHLKQENPISSGKQTDPGSSSHSATFKMETFLSFHQPPTKIEKQASLSIDISSRQKEKPKADSVEQENVHASSQSQALIPQENALYNIQSIDSISINQDKSSVYTNSPIRIKKEKEGPSVSIYPDSKESAQTPSKSIVDVKKEAPQTHFITADPAKNEELKVDDTSDKPVPMKIEKQETPESSVKSADIDEQEQAAFHEPGTYCTPFTAMEKSVVEEILKPKVNQTRAWLSGSKGSSFSVGVMPSRARDISSYKYEDVKRLPLPPGSKPRAEYTGKYRVVRFLPVPNTYRWLLMGKPPGSKTVLEDTDQSMCKIEPDLAGEYTLWLHTTLHGGKHRLMKDEIKFTWPFTKEGRPNQNFTLLWGGKEDDKMGLPVGKGS